MSDNCWGFHSSQAYRATSPSLEVHVRDGQAFPDGPVLINGAAVYDDPTSGGMNFSGDSAPNANPALVASASAGGPQSRQMTSMSSNDCLSLVITLVEVEA